VILLLVFWPRDPFSKVRQALRAGQVDQAVALLDQSPQAGTPAGKALRARTYLATYTEALAAAGIPFEVVVASDLTGDGMRGLDTIIVQNATHLDEPTAALTEQEVAILLDILRELRRRGIAMIYISHKLDEVLAIADRLTVLRDGQSIVTLEAQRTDKNEVIKPSSETTVIPEEQSQRGETAAATPAASKVPEALPAGYGKLLAEKEELYDRLLRKQAELENYRKRRSHRFRL
jgi:hypothetical protein